MNKYLIIVCILFLESCDFFVSGSYGKAEYYDFAISTQSLIKEINEFKQNNPQYETRSYLDGEDNSGNFYKVYFYLKDENALLYCVLVTGKERKSKNARLGFHYVESSNFSKDGRINSEDLTKEENKRIKEKFETEILSKIAKWK